MRGSAERIQRALALIHGGRLREAGALCAEVVAGEPQNFNAHLLLGQLTLQSRDYSDAARWLTAARFLNPGHAAVHSNLAVALLALRRPAEALACCDVALRLQPNFPEAHCNRGNALRDLNRHAEGLDSYERALSIAARFYDAHLGRINALLSLRRYSEALGRCDETLHSVPRSIDVWCLRGAVLLKLKRPTDALAAFDQALSIAPDSAEAHNNRGTALRDLRRLEEALEAYQRALRLRPKFPEVYCNVANVGLDMGKVEEAVNHCDNALNIQPGFLEALNIRGTALRLLKRFDEAASTYEKILDVAPSYGHALSHLLSSRASLGDWSQWAEHADRIVARITTGDSASSPHTFLWICDSAAAQLQCARLYTADQFPGRAPLWSGQRYAHRRLRVAYLSADFAEHPVAYLIAGALERHDRSRIETVGVSLYRDPTGSAMELRMRNAFDHFYDASEAADAEIAMRLREREIDIVVDLTGHTRNGRMGVLAHRPAPVQINYLGFTGTSGAEYVDYIVGDAVAIPADQERFLSEQLICMPHSFLPNDDAQLIAPSTPRRSDLGLPEANFVFCAFNNTYKINPPMFDVWMGLLRETPGSVLWLRGAQGTVIDNLRHEATIRGVEGSRLIFAARVPRMGEHLARYRQADLFLDTLPYGAHATARDALWAGLPVLTCAGDGFASRVAASLLSALDLPELIALNYEDYTHRALTLAHSPLPLAELRAKLAHHRAVAPAFDTDLYRQHLEASYFHVHRRQQQGELPARCKVSEVS